MPNDCFIKLYGLSPDKGTAISEGFGKYFEKPDISLASLLRPLNGKNVGSKETFPINRLGFCAGSGHGLMKQVLDLKIDTFITGEVSYHDEVFARMNNIRLIVVGHKQSEDCIKKEIKLRLEKENLQIPTQII